MRYHRASRLMAELMLSHADEFFPKPLNTLIKSPLLLPDDWLLGPLSACQARDMLAIIIGRYGRT